MNKVKDFFSKETFTHTKKAPTKGPIIKPTKKDPKSDPRHINDLDELKDQLHSKSEEDQQTALTKIVLATSEGKDCGFMFMDVLNIVTTTNIRLKQLIYLYISAYATSDSERAILVVNSLIIDSKHYSPHIRGLALRTMGNIKLEMTAEYFVQPLLNGLEDKDAYVRRCAVLGLLKLLHISNANISRENIYNSLVKMLEDSDGNVLLKKDYLTLKKNGLI